MPATAAAQHASLPDLREPGRAAAGSAGAGSAAAGSAAAGSAAARIAAVVGPVVLVMWNMRKRHFSHS